MSTTTSIKVILTKVGTAYSATQQYRLHDYIVIDDCTMYVCKRVDPTTMTCVGHDLSDSLYWDKCIDLSEAEAKATAAATTANDAAAKAVTATTNADAATAKANTATSNANTATANANTATTKANTAAQTATDATATMKSEVSATVTQAKSDVATAVADAETATTNANTAAANADTAREAIQATVDQSQRLADSIGPYTDRTSITLSPLQTNKAISADGTLVSKSGWAIAQFTAELGNEYLFKPGETSSDVCVFAEKVDKVETRAIDYAYTYGTDGKVSAATATYNGKTYTYTYTYDDSGQATITDQSGNVVSSLPSVYTTTVGSYQPMTRLNAGAELPEDGYCRFVSNFQAAASITVVVSYKVGSADLTMRVLRDGMTASMCTQLSKINQKVDSVTSKVEPTGLTVELRTNKDAFVVIDEKKVTIPARTSVTLHGSALHTSVSSPWSMTDEEKTNAASIRYLKLSGKAVGRLWCANTKIERIYTEGLDTSKVTAMDWMFSACSSLTSLDVSGWDTSKVTAIVHMFNGCSSLTSLDVSGFDTSKVTAMGGMFYNCSSLTSLDVSGFDTSKVTAMDSMFNGCSSLTSLDVSGFDISKVTNMDYMFSGCSSLTSLDVSGWDTSKVTNMGYMFRDCSSLTALDVSGWDTSKVTGIVHMFNGCSSLTALKFGEGFGKAEASGLALSLGDLGSSKNYQLADETYTSMLTMYDRATAGLPTMTIQFNSKHNIPDGFIDSMTAKGYTITR